MKWVENKQLKRSPKEFEGLDYWKMTIIDAVSVAFFLYNSISNCNRHQLEEGNKRKKKKN